MLDGVRILLIDDHAVVRSSLALLLNTVGAQVVGEASEGQKGIDEALRLRPDVILMDITLPDMDGIEATRQIRKAWPQARVLALTMHSEETYLVPFLEAGGAGYIRKAAADRDLFTAIETIRDGKTFLGSAGLDALIHEHRSTGAKPAPPRLSSLSDRERFVLEQTVRGFTSREIADQLGISSRTVDTYRYRVMEKLGLKHRHELVEYALQNHLLE
jgi:two-component system, NarL family, response regulator NreC